MSLQRGFTPLLNTVFIHIAATIFSAYSLQLAVAHCGPWRAFKHQLTMLQTGVDTKVASGGLRQLLVAQREPLCSHKRRTARPASNRWVAALWRNEWVFEASCGVVVVFVAFAVVTDCLQKRLVTKIESQQEQLSRPHLNEVKVVTMLSAATAQWWTDDSRFYTYKSHRRARFPLVFVIMCSS